MKMHPDCYKIKDTRIELVLAGRMSLESFMMTAGPNDPFVLMGDTIYALSEEEFYSTRKLRSLFDLSEQAFKHVMDLADISFMSEEDQALVKKVRQELPTCPVCKYKRYKQAIQKLVDKYKLKVVYSEKNLIDEVKYPEVTGKIESTVTFLMDKPYVIPDMKRLPCMDCVEKHVAQAHILACESLMGYPEHRVLMCGHLAEAIDESPKEFPELRQTLQVCMSTTMKTGEPFLPIYSVLTLIRYVREQLQASDAIETRTENPTVVDTIDITPEIKQEVAAFSYDLRRYLLDYAERIRLSIFQYKTSRQETDRILFEGWLACMADCIVYGAPLFANMLRNRRLMFVADPALAFEAGYDFNDIIQLLKPE